jgi:hypothetical protein
MAGAFFSQESARETGGHKCRGCRFVCKRSVFQIDPVSRPEAGYELQVNSKLLKIRGLRQWLFGIRTAFNYLGTTRRKRQVKRAKRPAKDLM